MRREQEVVGIRQDDHAVTVEVRTTGGVRELSARYLAGCDGAGQHRPRARRLRLRRQEKLRPGFHYTPHGVYVHGLGVSRMSTVEFVGPPRQVEPLTVEEPQDSIRRVSGTDVTITTMSSGTRWIDTANLGRKLAAVVHGWVGEDILDTYTTERHPVAARLPQHTRAQLALMRPDPQTRALWEMFSDLMDLDDASLR